MQPSGSGISSKAIGWALLSQVFWVPLVAIDLHDRWTARQREITPPGKALPPSPLARATPFSLNDLLGAARPVQQLAGQANQAVSGALGQAVQGASSGVGVLLSSAGSSASSLLDRPFTVSLESSGAGSASAAATGASGPSRSELRPGTAQPANTLLGRAFTRAQLLGGTIGLADLQEGPMAPLALAERALQRGSGDPLAPLPSLWREPMRQALLKLPGAPLQLSPARLVVVPSRTVSQPVEVPLALQSDGSVDILEAPSNPAVLREIDGWSRQQRLPATGSLVPAVVHLHPLTPEAAVAPSASSRPAASGAAQGGAVHGGSYHSGASQSGGAGASRAVRAEAAVAAPAQLAPAPAPTPAPAAFAPAEVAPAPAPEPVAVAAPAAVAPPAAAEAPAQAVAPAP